MQRAAQKHGVFYSFGIDRKAHIFLPALLLYDEPQVLQLPAQVEGLALQLHLPLLQGAHIQNVIQQGQQVAGRHIDLVQAIRHHLGLLLVFADLVHHAHDAIHRRPDIMAHVGQENTLGLVSPHGLLVGPLQLPLVVQQRADVLRPLPVQDHKHGADTEHDDHGQQERDVEALVVPEHIGKRTILCEFGNPFVLQAADGAVPGHLLQNPIELRPELRLGLVHCQGRKALGYGQAGLQVKAIFLDDLRGHGPMADGIVRLTGFHRLQNVRIGVIFHILALQIIGSGNDGADHQRHPLSRQSACAVHGIPAVDPQLIRAHGDGPQCALHVGEDLQAQQHIRLMIFQPFPALHPGAGLKDHVPFQPVGRLCNDLDVQPGQLPILIEIGIGAEIIV